MDVRWANYGAPGPRVGHSGSGRATDGRPSVRTTHITLTRLSGTVRETR
ncbi:hypothetical protein [Frankia umida]|nr:hypothetical protein [Frankia umida]